MGLKEHIVFSTVIQSLAMASLLDALQSPTEERRINLPNIVYMNVEEDTSIFFLDTTTVSEERAKIVLKARTACSVESAARIHPKRNVYLLYTTPGFISYKPQEESDEHIQTLLSFDNVVLAYMNVTEFTLYTPVERLVKSKIIDQSEHMRNHYSDLLRLVIMWKYGGIYLDADVLVLKSFNQLKPNFVSAESKDHASNAILVFRDKKFRNTLQWVLSVFNKTYNATDWGENGPVLITRYVMKLCRVKKFSSAIEKTCRKLFVYPKDYFMPLHVGDWRKYFEARYNKEIGILTRDNYAIHFWNCSSSARKLPLKADVTYINLAREHCPNVIQNVDSIF